MRIFKQPLFHFLILGLILFGLYSLAAGRQADRSRKIVVSAQQVEYLTSIFTKQWSRPPTEQELAGLIDSHIREEVLYREALALGLDRDDVILRRRLAQKIEMLARDLATQGEPGDQELRTFFEKNADRFESPSRISFSHVYVNTDVHGDDSAAMAARVLSELQGGQAPGKVGDRFMLPSDFRNQSPAQVARQFGAEFSGRVFELETGSWKGPVLSGYGLHLVLVREREDAYLPPLEDVKETVRNEFQSNRRREADKAFYAKLLEGYEVSVERSVAP